MIELNFSLLIKAVLFFFTSHIIFQFSIWLINYINTARVINKIKGLPMLPLIGSTHLLGRRNDFLKQLNQLSKKHKDEPFFRLWLGSHPVILFHKADYLDILVTSSKNTQKSFEYKFLYPWLKTGLLTSHGDKWQYRRRLLTPTFHFEILNDFLFVMNEQSEILIDVLTQLSKKNEEIDIFKRVALCALDIICETAMGQNVNAQRDQDSDYVKAVSEMGELVFSRMINPFIWFDPIHELTQHGRNHKRCLKILHDFTKKVILERNEEFENYNYQSLKRIAFLDMLLKAKHEDPTISFEDIQEEVDTFMFEGHDTTAAATSWACHLIGSNPDVQKKLHEEIDNLFGTSDRPLTNDDFKELKYLDCCIKESLRLFPSVPLYSRTISEDANVGDYKVLKGCTATIACYFIHRDEKYYPDPEKFDPDRFLPQNSKDRHPYAYIPFSAGRRNCIGQRFALMEMKVVLTNILRKFEIKSLKTSDELKPSPDLIIRPTNGLPVTLKLRY